MKKLFALVLAALLTAVSVTAVAAENTADTETSATYETTEEDEMKITDIQYANAGEALERTEPKVFTAKDGSALNYRAYYSPAYSADDKTKSAMLFLFLHGSGEKGDDNEAQIKGQKNLVNFLVSADAEKVLGHIPYVVIAPQCPLGEVTAESPKGSQWVDTAYSKGSYSIDDVAVSKPLSLVIEMLDSMVENDNIDKSNIVVSGVSMGGYGAWDLALRRPDLVKSLIPICGGGDPSKASALAEKRIWVFHCDGDTQVPVEGSREMVEALEKVGADVKYTEFNKPAHNAWWPAATEVSDPTLLEWVFDGIEYNVTLKAIGGGSLTASKTPVKNGGSSTVTATPNKGYTLKKLCVNGEAVAPTEKDGAYSYTVANISGHVEVSAEFEESALSSEDSSADSNKPANPKKKPNYPLWIALGVAAVGTVIYFVVKSRKKK